MKSNCHFEIKANIDYFLIKSAVWGRGRGAEAAARRMTVSLQKDWMVKGKGCPLKWYLHYLHLHRIEIQFDCHCKVQKWWNWQCNVIVNGTALKIYKFPDNVLWDSDDNLVAAPLLLMFAPHIIAGVHGGGLSPCQGYWQRPSLRYMASDT